MNNDMKGFHAVITGASYGMGFEMAKALLSHGATVAIGARAGERLEKAYAALKAEGFDVHALKMDVRNVESVDAAAAWVADNWPRLDMLVNNAGISMNVIKNNFGTKPDLFFNIAPQDFYDVVETNFIGYFLVARAFVPIMLRHGGGKMVNISTGYGIMVDRGQLPYGPSRAGAEAMSVIMSKQLMDLGIMVNSLSPGGLVATGFVPEEARVREKLDLLDASIMNDVILFLASDRSAGITGEKITATEFGKWLEEKGI